MENLTGILRRISKHWFLLLIAIAVFTYTRLYGVSNPYIKAYDPYYFYRVAEGILKNGFWNPQDPLRYYPFGWDSRELAPGVPYTLVFFAKLPLSNLLASAKIVPFFFGILTLLSFAFLGALYGFGSLAALILAVIPSFLYRTSQGFADKEPIAFFLGVTSWYFFVRFLEEERIEDAIIAGVSLGLIGTLWGGRLLFFAPILLATLLLFDNPEKMAKASVIFFLYVLLAALVPRYSNITRYPFEIGVLGLGVATLLYYFFTKYVRFDRKRALLAVAAIAAVGVAAVGVTLYNNPFAVFNSFIHYAASSLVSKTRITHANTVAENQPPRFSLKLKENTYWLELGFPFFFALFLIIPVLLEGKNLFKDKKTLFLVLLVYLALLAGSKGIRLLSFTAFGVALASAYWFKFLASQNDRVYQFLAIPLAILIFWPIARVTLSSAAVMGTTSMNEHWWEALKYIKFNLPDAVPVVTWWDYGYWIQTVAGHKTLGDGGNVGPGYKLNWYTGHFFATSDYENATSWLKSWNLTYVLVDRTMIPKYWAYSTLGGISNVMSVLNYRGKLLTDFGMADVYTGYSDDLGPIALAVFQYNNTIAIIIGQLTPEGIPRWLYVPKEFAYFSSYGGLICPPIGYCNTPLFPNLGYANVSVVIYDGAGAIIGDLNTMHSTFARLWFFNGFNTDFTILFSNPEVKIFEYV